MCARRDHFKAINDKKGLTEEDRKQIKKFYLEKLISPEARKLLQKHFPEKFPAEKPANAHQSNLLRNAEAHPGRPPRPFFDCAYGDPHSLPSYQCPINTALCRYWLSVS